MHMNNARARPVVAARSAFFPQSAPPEDARRVGARRARREQGTSPAVASRCGRARSPSPGLASPPSRAGSGRPEARPASGGLGHSSGGQAIRRLKRRGSSGGPSWTRTFAAAAGIQRSSSPDDDAEGGFPSSEASDKEANAQTIMVFLVELGLMAMSIVDTAMVGHVGEEALAAASLGGIATWLVIITNMGLVGGLDPLTSQAHGAGNDAAVARYLHSGIRAAFLLAALGSLAMLGAEPSSPCAANPPPSPPPPRTTVAWKRSASFPCSSSRRSA